MDHKKIRGELIAFGRMEIQKPLSPFLLQFTDAAEAEKHLDSMEKLDTYFTPIELALFAEKIQRPVGLLNIDYVLAPGNRLTPHGEFLWGAHYPGDPILLYHRPILPVSDVLNHFDLLISK